MEKSRAIPAILLGGLIAGTLDITYAFIYYAFTEMNRDHVISLIDPANLASIKVAERLGEKVEGKTGVLGREVLIYGIGRERGTGTSLSGGSSTVR